MKPSAKVLLIRLSSLGDVVLATAAVEALAEDVPEAEIHVLTKPPFREVFVGNPRVASAPDWDPKTQSIFSLARMIRRARYDWVVDLHGNLRTRALRLLVQNCRWTDYRKGTLRRRLAVFLSREAILPKTHVVDRYVAALKPLGVQATRRLPRLYPSEEERATADRLLFRAGWDGMSRLIGFAPGARWPTKMWPREHWISLLRSVKEGDLGFAVFVGGPDEAGLCREILRESGAAGANLAGETALLASAAALQGAAAVVTNDSASLHLATAVGTPVVALFGPTVRGFGFFPWGSRDVLLESDLSCRPCSLHGGERCPRGHHRCLEEIPPGDVVAELRRIVIDPSTVTLKHPPSLGEVR